MDGEWVEDNVPDSQSLTVLTPNGHIVLMGCGHSGTVNALEHIRTTIADAPIHALMGGLHLFAASDETLGWTAVHEHPRAAAVVLFRMSVCHRPG